MGGLRSEIEFPETGVGCCCADALDAGLRSATGLSETGCRPIGAVTAGGGNEGDSTIIEGMVAGRGLWVVDEDEDTDIKDGESITLGCMKGESMALGCRDEVEDGLGGFSVTILSTL